MNNKYGSPMVKDGAIGNTDIIKSLTVSEIAHAIAKDWQTINPYANEYLNAMKEITDINGSYYADSAKSVVMYFLANAGTYRGDNARTYKALLKAMVK